MKASEYLEWYNEHLNDCIVHVCGLEFEPSDILKKMDPIAYRVGFNDYLDFLGVDSDNIDWNISI